jgi:hypothetical protein
METQLTVKVYGRSTRLFSVSYENYGDSVLDVLVERLSKIDQETRGVEIGNDLFPDLAKIKESYKVYAIFSVYKEQVIMCVFYETDTFVALLDLDHTLLSWRAGDTIPVVDETATERYSLMSELTDKEVAHIWNLIENSVSFVIYGKMIEDYE